MSEEDKLKTNNEKVTINDYYYYYLLKCEDALNELEKWLEEDLKQVYRDAGHRHNLILEVLDKLQELKGSDKE